MRQRVHARKRTREAAAAPVGDPRGMGAAMAIYLEQLRARGMTEQTVKTRTSGLRQFVAWCEERSVLRAEEVTRGVVECYQRWLHGYEREDGRRLTIRTQLGRLQAVRGLFGWLAKTNRIAYNPAGDLELPKTPVRLPRDVLTAEEAERVLEQAEPKTLLGLRDRAILEVLYSTGMRRMEVAGLDVEDVEAERGVAMIREGKGRKDRVVPVGERALWWVSRYLREARPWMAVDETRGPLFVTETGERLSGSWLTDRVTQYVERSGVAKKGSCHLFRHTCATLRL